MLPETPNRIEAKRVLMTCSDAPIVGEFYLIGSRQGVWKIDHWHHDRQMFNVVGQSLNPYRCTGPEWEDRIFWAQWRDMQTKGLVKFLSVEIDDYGLCIGEVDDWRAWAEAISKARSLGMTYDVATGRGNVFIGTG